MKNLILKVTAMFGLTVLTISMFTTQHDVHANNLFLSNVEVLTQNEDDKGPECSTVTRVGGAETNCGGIMRTTLTTFTDMCQAGSGGSCWEGYTYYTYDCQGNRTGGSQNVEVIYCN